MDLISLHHSFFFSLIVCCPLLSRFCPPQPAKIEKFIKTTVYKESVFRDATHGVNKYGFPVFTLVVRDSHGHGGLGHIFSLTVLYCFTTSHSNPGSNWKHPGDNAVQ